MRTRLVAIFWVILLTAVVSEAGTAQSSVTQDSSAGLATTPSVLTTTVRRVVLDVSVTDAKGLPVPGLTAADFIVTEDGKPQRILTFDANGFSSKMDYLPPALPPQPANTFINLPDTPEKGPLYVLFYDLVNMDSWAQMDSPEDHGQQMMARQQLVKFIEGKPEGTRFAIFVRSDGLHLIQGFTSNKALLYRAIDPHNPKPHIPDVFLLGSNFGQGDRLSALYTLNTLANYLSDLPGRKNLVWFASQFPLSLFASDSAGPNFQEETKATLNLLAHDQIAIYPVYASGVPAHDSYDSLGTSVHSDSISSSTSSGPAGGSSGGIGVGSSPSTTSTYVLGSSTVMNGYNIMDAIAEETGGRAFYGTNDVASELVKATESGEVYYTLTYSPTNEDYDGKLRQIHVELTQKGDTLAYRRSYYGIVSPVSRNSSANVVAVAERGKTETSPVEDELSGYMEHGAPTGHQLVFVVKARTAGAPVTGTPEEMTELAMQPAYLKSENEGAAKPLRPVLLQEDVFRFDIPIREFSGESSLDLEVGTAVYNADGERMNSLVRVAKKDLGEGSGATEQPLFFRIDQALEVPIGATSVRFAVRDTRSNRIGAMEIHLPLAPESNVPGLGKGVAR